jgi:hypothetical protein
MRISALRTALGALATLALLTSAASAETWRDPNGRVTFDAPRGWVMEVLRANPSTIVIAGSANNECYIMAVPNPGTANASADAMRNRVEPITAAAWAAVANSISSMFPHDTAVVDTQSLDTSGYWPINRATLSGGERPVIGALTARPGVDLIALCWTYAGADATATYEAVFRSLAHPSYPNEGPAAEPTLAPAPTLATP